MVSGSNHWLIEVVADSGIVVSTGWKSTWIVSQACIKPVIMVNKALLPLLESSR